MISQKFIVGVASADELGSRLHRYQQKSMKHVAAGGRLFLWNINILVKPKFVLATSSICISLHESTFINCSEIILTVFTIVNISCWHRYVDTHFSHPCELGTHFLGLFDHASLQHVLGTLWVDESVGGVQSLGFIHPPNSLSDVPSMLREKKG